MLTTELENAVYDRYCEGDGLGFTIPLIILDKTRLVYLRQWREQVLLMERALEEFGWTLSKRALSLDEENAAEAKAYY